MSRFPDVPEGGFCIAFTIAPLSAIDMGPDMRLPATEMEVFVLGDPPEALNVSVLAQGVMRLVASALTEAYGFEDPRIVRRAAPMDPGASARVDGPPSKN